MSESRSRPAAGTYWRDLLLQLLGLRFEIGDFALEVLDFVRLVGLLLGAGKLLAELLQPLVDHVEFLLGFFVHAAVYSTVTLLVAETARFQNAFPRIG